MSETKSNELQVLSETKPKRPEDFAYMDEMDAKQIVAEYQGLVMEEVFYSFGHGKNRVVGISYKGTKELASDLALRGVMNIDVEDVEVASQIMALDDQTRRSVAMRKAGGKGNWNKIKPDEQRQRLEDLGDEWPFFVAKAHVVDRREDGSVRRGTYGIAACDSTEPFAIIKACSKAKRNGIRELLPEASILAFVGEAMRSTGSGELRGKQGGTASDYAPKDPPPKAPPKQAPPKASPPKASPPKANGVKLAPDVREWAETVWKGLAVANPDDEWRRSILSDCMLAKTSGRLDSFTPENVAKLMEKERNEIWVFVDEIVSAQLEGGEGFVVDVAKLLFAMNRADEAGYILATRESPPDDSDDPFADKGTPSEVGKDLAEIEGAF